MNKKDIDVFLNKLNKNIQDVYQINDKMFYEDKMLDRYKDMAYILELNDSEQCDECQLGGSNNEYKNFTNKWNNDQFKNQIDTIERSIYHKHGVIFSTLIDKIRLKSMIEIYIFTKYKLFDYNIFVSGKASFIDQLKYKNPMYINIVTPYNDFVNQIQEYLNYIEHVINSYLKDNGTVILYCPLLLPNKLFYEFFLKLMNRFGSIKIFFPLYFLNNNTNCYIILMKYGQSAYIQNVSEKLVLFYEQINNFLLEEYKIYDNILNIKYKNKNMFDIIVQKYISASMLKYNIETK